MARRPDFAQKLLDDLRLRKERMGIASSSGSRSVRGPSAAAVADAHGNSQWSLRGSREATANNFSSSNMINTEVTKIWLGTRHQKTPPYGASQDIVPFRGATHVDHTIDVSMALALAMSNSGKLQNIEFFSNATVVGEVSKGVQQLNKILKACSNGLSLSRDSIDIGRELLKGAMDLEESLRMLVSLQEASDYMVASQGKQARLLKGKEDEESSSREVNRKKLMNRPRFSFDGPSLHSHKHDREGGDADFQDQTKLALSYLEKPKTPTSNSNKSSSKVSIKSISHRRSLSCGSGSKADDHFSGVATKNSHCEELKSFKNESNDSSSTKNIKQLGPKANPANEKLRIPNVVAKLMGLEELPLPKAEVKNGEVQKNPKSSNRRETTQTSKTSSIDPENKKEVDNITHSEKKLYQMDIQKKVLQEKGIMEPKATHNAKAMDSKGKTNSKNLNNIEDISSALKHSPKPQSKLNNKQIDMTNMYPTKESRATKKEVAETGETTDVKEQTYRGNAQQIVHNAEKPLLEHDIQGTPSLPYIDNDDAVKHELAQRTKDQPLKGKRNLGEVSIIPSNQSNTSNDKAAHQQPAAGVFKSKHAGNEIPTEKEQIARSKPQRTVEKKGELKSNNTERASDDMSTQKVLTGSSTAVASKRTPTDTTNKAQLKNRRSTHHEMGRKSVGGSLGERRPFGTPRTDKEKATPPLLETVSKKSPHILSAPNVDVTKTLSHITQSNGYLEEQPRRIETPSAERRHLKDSTSLLQELERRWKERSGKAKGVIVSSHAMNSGQHLQHKTATYNALTNDCGGRRFADRRTIVENYDHDITITAPPAQQHPDISPKDDVEQQLILRENVPEGPQDRMQPNPAMSVVDKQGSLTRNEYILKQIMINSQHFLNTAQALFKLKIPVGVLQASENACSDEGSKLLLDCGYEIMRRKGKNEEAIFPKRMPFAPAKVGCLDALIKELNDDLECLKAPSKIEGDDNDTAECLHKLLEREIQNRNPDVNCMWDFGWNTTSFGDVEKHEVIRDVEKHVLNGLINELARDLANVSITT